MSSSSPVVVPTPDDIKAKLAQITSDHLYLKIADTADEIEQAQRLRYKVFYEEMGAHPDGDMGADGREIEFYDNYCDHLLVVDSSLPQGEQIVGTYRILRQEMADANNIKFYTENEFDLGKLRAQGGKIMEVSRSCVLPSHRSRMAINLLWKGIAACVFAQKVDYLIGTPSMNGTNMEDHLQILAYLKNFHMADESIRPRVIEEFYHPLPEIDKDSMDQKRAFMALPPLLKGYMRLGAVIGDGVYIDHQFNCIDVAIIVEINKVTDRYFNHYTRGDNE